ncbi:MAG: glycosyltransferase family 9 protein [Sedimentisphaerales bacterium]|nr:glycosyltransferase family 9 protein [Sedimentisphaerales bacterium]
MPEKSNILDLVIAEDIKAELKTKRALIIQPGAIGDCILTLPLASFMKNVLHLGYVDFLGHTEYIGIFPGRTDVDKVSSIDLMDIHRLFMDSSEFVVQDNDPLIKAFSEYLWVISFLGKPESNFETNLIFTINCNQTSEVITLPSKPLTETKEHITDYFIHQLLDQCGLSSKSPYLYNKDYHIKATETDLAEGKNLLWELGLEPQKKLVVIQPGAGALNKCWHVDNYLSIVNELRSKNIQVVFLLGPAELERFRNETIQSLTKATKCLTELPLTDVLKIMTCTDVFLGNDSGITHLAASMGIKTLVLFGPTNPNTYKPNGPNVKIFKNKNKTFSEKPSIKLQEKITNILLKDILHT